MKKVYLLGVSCLLLIASGCASVTVTKTAKGYFPPTDPDEVEILVTVPQDRGFIELATVTTQKWSTSATAKMHNSLRAKCAPLGANAVVLGSSGIDYEGYYWASGVAIRFKNPGTVDTVSYKQQEEKTDATTQQRKIIGWRVDPSQKGPDGGFLKMPVYEEEQNK